MKLTFSVNYRTEWGESLWIAGTAPALEGGVPMHLDGQETWTAVVDVPEDAAPFEYGYEVRHENGGVKKEWGHPRTFRRADNAHRFYVCDRWQDQPWDKPYYSMAFTDCICRREERDERQLPSAGMLTLTVDAPMIAQDEAVAVSGEDETLGAWMPEKALRMSDADYPTWSVNIPLSVLREGTDYKFLIVKKATGAKVDALDCLKLAEEAGSSKAVNIVLMGRLSHYFDLPDEAWQKSLEAMVPPKFLELNKKAFALGKDA